MLGWFRKSTDPNVGDIARTLEECGIRFASDDAREAVFKDVTGYLKAGTNPAESILCAMGDEQLDPATFEQLPWLSNDVWHFDYEAIEDHGAYVAIVNNCLRISGGRLNVAAITDFVDVEEGEAWVEFDRLGKRLRIDLSVDNDWADPSLFAKLNDILLQDGSDVRFAQHDLGQDCLIVCRNADEIHRLNKFAGLNFRQIEG